MAIVRELVTFLGYEVDDAALKKAKDEFAGLQALAKAVVGAVAATTGALAALAVETSDYADDVASAAAALGITTGSLQRMEYAASTARVEAGALRSTLRDLQRNAYESTVGNADLAGTFWRLGVSVRASNGRIKDADQLFLDVNAALAKVPDSGRRAAFALKLMGGEGAKINTIFQRDAKAFGQLSAQAELLGLVMDETAIRAGQEFARDLSTARFELSALGRVVGSEVIPYARQLLTWVRSQVRGNRELIRNSAVAVIRALARALEIATAIARRFGIPIAQAIRWMGGLRAVADVAGAALGVAFVVKLGRVVAALGKTVKAAKGAITAVRFLALAPALAGIKWLALATIVALVIDDILTYARGGKSVLGDFLEVFSEPIKPDDTWPVVATKKIVEYLTKGLQLLKDFRDKASEVFDVAGDIGGGLGDKASEYAGAVADGVRKVFRGGPPPPTPAPLAGPESARRGAPWSMDPEMVPVPLWRRPDSSYTVDAGLGGGSGLRPTSTGTTTITIPISVVVDAAGARDPAAVADAVGGSVEEAAQAVIDRALEKARLSQDRVVR